MMLDLYGMELRATKPPEVEEIQFETLQAALTQMGWKSTSNLLCAWTAKV